MDKEKIIELCCDGLFTDGGHHKQWYLAEILKIVHPTAYDEIKNDIEKPMA